MVLQRGAVRQAIAAIIVWSTFLSVTAQDNIAYKHPLTDMPPANENVETTYWFHSNEKKHFPAGQTANVIVGFHNAGSEPLNVSAIMGSINSPFEFSMYVQNFTYQMYDARVEHKHELSLEYSFIPSSALQPREFTLALTVFYHNDKLLFSTTFFNSTVEVTEPVSLIDSQLIFLWLICLAIVVAILYAFSGYLSGLGFVKKASKRPKKDAPKAETDANEWLKGTHYDSFAKRQAKKVVKKTE